MLAKAERHMHKQYGELKQKLLAHLPATVVELGSGAGANLRYLPRGTRLIAIEPNTYMHAPLRAAATARGIELDLRSRKAEELDLETASVGFVFASLVLCTVDDPAQVVREVRRVLRPNGRFVCIEHVAAPAGSGRRRAQELLRRPWHWVFEGCDLCRDTGAILRAAGFASAEIDGVIVPSGLAPVAHHIAAVCQN
jgi:SAM-dependent methyltransferase